jgi:hypothetical protein
MTDAILAQALATHPDRLVLPGADRRCRICGCSQHQACIDPEHGPCWWVELDLCSHCGEPAIVAGEYDRIIAKTDGTTDMLVDVSMWSHKARAALERVSRTDPAEFEI